MSGKWRRGGTAQRFILLVHEESWRDDTLPWEAWVTLPFSLRARRLSWAWAWGVMLSMTFLEEDGQPWVWHYTVHGHVLVC